MKAMKTMKAMKAKRVSVIAKGKLAKAVVFRVQGEDLHGAEEDRPDEDQGREDRDEEAARRRQEGLRAHQGLDLGRAEGSEGPRRQWLPGSEEGVAALQEGQGDLWPVSAAVLDARV